MRPPIYEYRITDYDPRLIPTAKVAELDRDAAEPSTWKATSGRSIGHPGWGLLYHVLLASLSPDRFNLILETGTNLGSSTMIMAQAIHDSGRQGVVRTIEIDAETAREAQRRISEVNLHPYVEFTVGDSLECLQQVLGVGDEVAVAFLDGNHFHDHVVREFELLLPFIKDDSIVVFDNTYSIAEGREDPRVNGALRSIVSLYGGHLINFPYVSWYTPGMALWQRQPFDVMVPPVTGAFDPQSG